MVFSEDHPDYALTAQLLNKRFIFVEIGPIQEIYLTLLYYMKVTAVQI